MQALTMKRTIRATAIAALMAVGYCMFVASLVTGKTRRNDRRK